MSLSPVILFRQMSPYITLSFFFFSLANRPYQLWGLLHIQKKKNAFRSMKVFLNTFKKQKEHSNNKTDSVNCLFTFTLYIHNHDK